MRTLYLDCFSGISGDMTLGAFIDLGIEATYLINELEKLGIDGYTINVSKKAKNGIVGTDVDVILKEDDGHQHRSFKDIKELIDKSTLNKEVKELSKKIFYYVAKAEAKIHSKTIDDVHFHEVGAIDSIVDIVGTAICFCKLDIEEVVASPLHTGVGTIMCQHGIIPVPAPATLEILRDGKVPFYSKGVEKELVTPTGAAIVAALADKFCPLPECEIVAVGYGCGKRDMKIANMLRMMIVETKKKLF